MLSRSWEYEEFIGHITYKGFVYNTCLSIMRYVTTTFIENDSNSTMRGFKRAMD